MTSSQKPFFPTGFWLITRAVSAVQILLKLHLGPADEMSANGKKSRAGKEGKIIWSDGKGRNLTVNLKKGH
jgi:hypothetical protein